MSVRRENIVGRQFGALRAVRSVGVAKNGSALWECFCACGVVKIVRRDALERQLSCGCVARELSSHCHRTHGFSNTPTWSSWSSMRWRCETPTDQAYLLYGARGIKVCSRWRKFENFLADMGERPEGTSLDRIDNNGNYTPSNCRWATQAEQMMNTRVFKGGVYRRDNGKFTVRITVKRKAYYLGTFKTKREALAARQSAEATLL